MTRTTGSGGRNVAGVGRRLVPGSGQKPGRLLIRAAAQRQGAAREDVGANELAGTMSRSPSGRAGPATHCGGCSAGQDRGDDLSSGHRIRATAGSTPRPGATSSTLRRMPVAHNTRRPGRPTVDWETVSRSVEAASSAEVGMPKLREPTDTWSGAGQPEVIGRWGKMRLVRYQARGPRRHPVPVLIVSPLLAKPSVLDLPLGSA